MLDIKHTDPKEELRILIKYYNSLTEAEKKSTIGLNTIQQINYLRTL